MDDGAFHRAVQRYAYDHAVSYTEAARAVAAGLEKPGAQFAESLYSDSDGVIDRRARHLCDTRGISYAEALRETVSSGDRLGPARGCSFVSFRDFDGALSAAVRAIEGQWIEIFREGVQISSDGDRYVFTRQDVEAIARNYSPRLFRAPLVIGHPDSNGPALGWVAALSINAGGTLLMKPEDIKPGLADVVQQGHFKKRSASFFSPSHPGNPTPGMWYLRHVGFLGAAQPSVQGLRDIAV